MNANEHARDLFLRLAAIKPEHVDDIANLLVASFQKAMDERCEACIHKTDAEIDLAKPLVEKAAAMADEADEWDKINNGVASTGGADGLGDRIRALLITAAESAAR